MVNVSAAVQIAFNVGQAVQIGKRELARDPWISPADGTIRMSDSPVIWMKGDSR